MMKILLCLTLLGLVTMTVATGDHCILSSLIINMGQDDCVLSYLTLQYGHSSTYCDTKLTCIDGIINAVHDSMPYENLQIDCVKLVKVTSPNGGIHLECTG